MGFEGCFLPGLRFHTIRHLQPLATLCYLCVGLRALPLRGLSQDVHILTTQRGHCFCSKIGFDVPQERADPAESLGCGTGTSRGRAPPRFVRDPGVLGDGSVADASVRDAVPAAPRAAPAFLLFVISLSG